MANSTLNPIEKLTHLSAQRTARTDRLHAAVRDLTDALERAGAEADWLSVTVDGWTLSYRNLRSNVGPRDCWSLGRVDSYGDMSDGCTDLGLAVDHEGYLHGDFNQPVTGPSRAHLIAFGQRAEQFVAAIVEQVEKSIARMDEAQAGVESALAEVK